MRLSSFGTLATIGPIVPTPMMMIVIIMMINACGAVSGI
jgi:hypothetical protein